MTSCRFFCFCPQEVKNKKYRRESELVSEYTLKRAREYECENSAKAKSQERPEFHVTGQVGWINDPNGFSVYKGEYHLFFQYHPYSTFWGPMHWGHVKTRDFVKWERLPVALAPDEEYDNKGCFSGSAIELDDGRQLLIYTGVSEAFHDGKDVDIQQQCAAIGDGINYEKIDKNPIIPIELIPGDGSKIDFRDPKIWKENGKYYLVAGNRASDGSGDILLYESSNFEDWKYDQTIDSCENRYGRMWECPDFFRLDGKEVLLVSPQDMEADGYEFHAGNGTVVLIGHAGEEKRFVRESAGAIDYGLDFYAPQTLLTPDGRRVMIAWMQNWDTCNQNHEDRNIYGQMTFPRELSIVDGRLCQYPVSELISYRSKAKTHTIDSGCYHATFDDVSGRVFDMELDIKAPGRDTKKEIKISLAKSEKYETTLTVDLSNKTMTFDRACSGGRRDIVSKRTCKIDVNDNEVALRIIMDHHGIEVFANHGMQAMSSMIYTPIESKSILFETSGNISAEIRFYDIEII